mgnify:CR=1 FL=1
MHQEEVGTTTKKSGMSTDQAVDYVVLAIDTKMRKVIFPWDAWVSNLIRPIVPDFVDDRLVHIAKL